MLEFIIFYSVMFFGLFCMFAIIYGSFALMQREHSDRS